MLLVYIDRRYSIIKQKVNDCKNNLLYKYVLGHDQDEKWIIKNRLEISSSFKITKRICII